MIKVRFGLTGKAISASKSRVSLFFSKAAAKQKKHKTAEVWLERAWRTAREGDVETAYRYGNMALRAGDNAAAVEAFSRVVSVRPDDEHANYKLGFALERTKEWATADEAYERAQSSALVDAGPIAFRRGRVLSALSKREDAMSQFRSSIRHGYRASDSYAAIYELEKSSPLWKRLETLRAGTESRSTDPKWMRDRGILASKMGYHEEAVEYLLTSSLGCSLEAKYQVDLARSYQALGKTAEADELLSKLAKTDKGPARTLGPGVYFRDRGHWREAISLFVRRLDETTDRALRANLQFEIGHAYDRQYQWENAKKWIERSLVTDSSHAYRHYRLGVVLERLGQYEQAEGPYAKALQLMPSKPHWLYRLGATARKAGREEAAVWAFKESTLPGSKKNSEILSSAENNPSEVVLRELGSDYDRRLDQVRQSTMPALVYTWQESLCQNRSLDNQAGMKKAYRELCRRKVHLSAEEASEFSQLLLDSGSTDEALNVLETTRDVQFPDGLDLKNYLSHRSSRHRSLFAEFQTNLALNEKCVLLESNHGSSIGCHPLALFREMSKDDRFENFTYVWAHTDDALIPDELLAREDVVLARIHSDLYLKYLATAKYLINNVTFAPYFVRRNNQVYLNTWHGTPMKSLGQSMRQGLLEYENIARNMVQATHVISPNKLTDWALFEDHRIARYATAARMITGSPRLDRLISNGNALREAIRTKLNVAHNERVVLYAPTWRGSVSDHQFDTKGLVEDLAAISGIPNARVFFRAHRLTEKLVRGLSLPVNIAPKQIDTNDLLSAIDVLVTDYSSIAFDFLHTERPIVFYTPDIEQYVHDRGLYLSREEFPGAVCESRAELVQTIERELSAPSIASESVIEEFSPFEDGAASRRTVNFMLEAKPGRVRTKPLLVFHASLIPNGIASALLALFNALDPEEYDLVLVVEGSVMRREPGRQTILSRLPDYVDLAFRVGDITASPEEQWAINRDATHDVMPSAPIKALRRQAWQREGRRVLGAAEPTAAIEFDGYATLWADLISSLGNSRTRLLIWQHNQLVDEWRTKYPELGSLFERYQDFDKIVPVSQALLEENRSALVRAGFHQDADFVPVANVLDYESIQESADQPIDEDLQEWMAPKFVHVVSIGRLSPEKNYGQLIEAWPNVVKTIPTARLTLVGSGLLEADLRARVEELGISESVLFAGQRSNPYPVLKHADLFVLPSTHEGQPVVILEAMVLGIPVAAAYTPGSAELIKGAYGKIIEHRSLPMSEDIIKILHNLDTARGRFDGQAYSRRALSSFLKTIED